MSISGNCVLLLIFLEKMPLCKNYFLFDEEKIEESFYHFEDRHSLVLCMLNIILNYKKFISNSANATV